MLLRRPHRCRCSRTGWRQSCSAAVMKLFDFGWHFLFLVIISPPEQWSLQEFLLFRPLQKKSMMVMTIIQVTSQCWASFLGSHHNAAHICCWAKAPAANIDLAGTRRPHMPAPALSSKPPAYRCCYLTTGRQTDGHTTVTWMFTAHHTAGVNKVVKMQLLPAIKARQECIKQ